MISKSRIGTVAHLARVTHPTILVAEDSADSREMMQVLLQMKGYQVITAGDGMQAIELALQKLPDLILIDLRLPKLDGLSVTKTLRGYQKTRSVPIVIISGYEATRYREAALDAGCDDYLMKPIDFERLSNLLHQTIPVSAAAAKSA